MPSSLMRPRRAVLQTPPKSSVPPRLPLYNCRPLLTPSKSTLLQLLIPLHFNSSRINTYKKPGRGSLLSTRKFCNSSLLTCHPICSHCNARNSNPLYGLLHDSLDARGGGYMLQAKGISVSLRSTYSASRPALGSISFFRYLLTSLLLSSVLPCPPHPGAIHA
jgi:hypothetical protein